MHDTVCEKRVSATIATHDLALIKGNINYDAKTPESIKVSIISTVFNLLWHAVLIRSI